MPTAGHLTGDTDLSSTAALEALLAPAIEAAGFAMVRVHMGRGEPPTLQVMAEDPATGQMTIDQCATLSRRLSALLDEADPIPGEYHLEVSSPGIDRPLTRAGDYARWAGHRARIELAEGMEIGGARRRRLDGRLDGIEGDEVLLTPDGDQAETGPLRLPLSGIGSARLLLTDALIAATRPLSTEGVDQIEEEAGDFAANDEDQA
jgi:ribosome maturation factor RimP